MRESRAATFLAPPLDTVFTPPGGLDTVSPDRSDEASRRVGKGRPDLAPDLVTTYADVTIGRDDVWLEANHAAVEARFQEWLEDLGVAPIP